VSKLPARMALGGDYKPSVSAGGRCQSSEVRNRLPAALNFDTVAQQLPADSSPALELAVVSPVFPSPASMPPATPVEDIQDSPAFTCDIAPTWPRPTRRAGVKKTAPRAPEPLAGWH